MRRMDSVTRGHYHAGTSPPAARYDDATSQKEHAMRWKIGSVTVSRVIELELPTAGNFVLPDASPENCEKISWLRPHFLLPDGKLVLSIHALVIESQGRRILVDTCLGNDKKLSFP